MTSRISKLEEEKRRLDAEIREYPTPIPRCDAQFNALFERRDAVVRELETLKTAKSARQ
jgi:predicted  nucleic acid-binding Zn-ribbon protein